MATPDDRPLPPMRSFTITETVDLLALVPIVLGFHPRESVVLLTFGGARGGFHARTDLARTPHEQADTAACLMQAAVVNAAESAAVVIYTEDVVAARGQARLLSDACASHALDLLDVIRVDGGRFYMVSDADDPGTAYDLDAHPLTAQRVFEGQVVHADREALAATLVGGEIEDGLDEAAHRCVDALLRAPGRAAREQLLVRECAWLLEAIAAATAPGAATVAAETAGRILALVAISEVREVVWSQLSRRTARAQVVLWADLVSRAPQDLLASACALLALASWLGGDGALAWCALDRGAAAEPDHPLGRVVAALLQGAVSPETWVPPAVGDLPGPRVSTSGTEAS